MYIRWSYALPSSPAVRENGERRVKVGCGGYAHDPIRVSAVYLYIYTYIYDKYS